MDIAPKSQGVDARETTPTLEQFRGIKNSSRPGTQFRHPMANPCIRESFTRRYPVHDITPLDCVTAG